MPDSFTQGLYDFLNHDRAEFDQENLMNLIGEMDQHIIETLAEGLDDDDRRLVDGKFNQAMSDCPYVDNDDAIKKEYFDDQVDVESDRFQEQREECIAEWLNQKGLYWNRNSPYISLKTFLTFRPRHISESDWMMLGREKKRLKLWD